MFSINFMFFSYVLKGEKALELPSGILNLKSRTSPSGCHTVIYAVNLYLHLQNTDQRIKGKDGGELQIIDTLDSASAMSRKYRVSRA